MKIFGIINITPDSFSDGGKFLNAVDVINEAQKMISQGADFIDIGAESTRPNATTLTSAEELDRLESVLDLFKKTKIPLSVDTRNADTAWQVTKYNNVKFLNDVSGFHSNEMIENAIAHRLTCIAMHSVSIPADPNKIIQGDAVDVILKWQKETVARLLKSGLEANQIILDPGIGFGKNLEQNWQIIDKIKTVADAAHRLGVKILVGHSRKSFLSKITSKPAAERDQETAELSRYLQLQGVDYIRVHNIELNKKFIGAGY